MTTTEPDPFEFATWTEPPDTEPGSPNGAVPPNRPTTWNGKPIPDNALWEDDGVTPKLTPTGRIRRSRGPRGSSGTVTPGKAAKVDLAQVESDMIDLWAKVAIGAQLQLPTVGMVIAHRGEATSRAMVQIAKNRPRMLAAMQKAATVGPAFELLQTGMMIVAAIGLDSGRTSVNDPIAIVTGVADLHRMVNPNAGMSEPVQQFHPPGGVPDEPISAEPPFIVKEPPGDIMDPEHARYSFSARPPGSASVVTPHAGVFGTPFPE